MAARWVEDGVAAHPGGRQGGFEMAIDTSVPRSRRAVLAASVGGAAALLAQALGRPLAADAANGDPVTVGGSFSGTAPTAITNSTGDAIQAINTSTTASGLFAHATAATGVTYGVFGRANSVGGTGVFGVNYSATGITYGVKGQADSPNGTAVRGSSTQGIGVYGASDSAIAVRGSSQSSRGVYGSSALHVGVEGLGAVAGVKGTSPNGPGVSASSTQGPGVEAVSTSNAGVAARSSTGLGVYAFSDTMDGAWGYGDQTGVVGWSGNNTGVVGYSGTGPKPPTTLPDVGVFGFAVDSSSARGVFGQSTNGRGVQGQATSGYGVRGLATSGTGLSGEASSGYALRTKGRVRFEQSAGKATIASGNVSVVVTPGIDLTSSTSIVATLNGNAGGSVAVKRVSIDTAANTFTIYLTANSTASVSVAWLVIS
jgi:hypothetical protein